MILGLVVGLVLVAVPLYLWRRPDPAAGAAGDDDKDAGSATIDGSASYIPLVDASVAPQVKIEPFKTIRCVDPGPGKTAPERCDHITFFEDGLTHKYAMEPSQCTFRLMDRLLPFLNVTIEEIEAEEEAERKLNARGRARQRAATQARKAAAGA